MKAAFVRRYNKIKIVDIPIPRPKENEVLLKIDACGICGSDFIEAKVWAKGWKRFGHEIAGTIAQTGQDITGLSVGDQVVVALSVPCGSCSFCIAGYSRKCNCLIAAEQGGFAEYLLVKDIRLLYKVDPPLPAQMACLAEPLTVILDAFQVADLQTHDHLLVVGGGNIGSLSLVAAKALNANVFGVVGRSINPGLTSCLNATGGNFFPWHTFMGMIVNFSAALKRKLSDLPGKLIVLHTAPPCYISKYLDSLPFDSTIVNIGLSSSSKENIIKLDTANTIFKRTQIMSAFPVPNMHMSRALSLIQEHFKLFSMLPFMSLSLEQLPRLIISSKSINKKVIITM